MELAVAGAEGVGSVVKGVAAVRAAGREVVGEAGARGGAAAATPTLAASPSTSGLPQPHYPHPTKWSWTSVA